MRVFIPAAAVAAVSFSLLQASQAFSPLSNGARLYAIDSSLHSRLSSRSSSQLLASIPSPEDFEGPDVVSANKSASSTVSSGENATAKKEIPEFAIYSAAVVILLGIFYGAFLQVSHFLQSGVILEEAGHLLVLLGQLLFAIGSGLFQALTVVVPLLGQAAMAGVHAAAPVVQEAATAATPYVQDATQHMAQSAAPYVQQATEQVTAVTAPMVEQAHTMADGVLQQATGWTDKVTQQATEQLSGSIEQVNAKIPQLFVE